MNRSIDYKSSGVDIEAGENAVKAIKSKVRTTYNRNVLGDLGSFGGLYRMDKNAWINPIIVSSTDGVGTKLLVAIMAQQFGTVGQDLVNHCVNDILVQGAIPQFFLDYIGVGKLYPSVIESIIDGFVIACKENSCALIGGEMAEMPGVYQDGDFDLAGTIIGFVEEDILLPRKSIQAGDILLGFPSSGLHTNGFSLARKVLFEIMDLDIDSYVDELRQPIGEALLSIHTSYLKPMLPFLSNPGLHALAHITGGGIGGNLSRVIPKGLQAIVELSKHDIAPIFQLIQKGGNIQDGIMRQTFNLGIGMICVASEGIAQEMIDASDAMYIGILEESTNVDNRVVFS